MQAALILQAEPDKSDIAAACRADEQFGNNLVSLMPYLKCCARQICRDTDLCDEFVQDTLVNAWRARGSFVPNTDLKAWLFTILRNAAYSHFRRRRRAAVWLREFDYSVVEQIAGAEGSQLWSIELRDTIEGLTQSLSAIQRQAIVAANLHGANYDELAALQRCAVGTAKSRVARARSKLRAWNER
jgi:RNA polymerase sigma-70 factor (ECF subfamily)